MRLRLTLPQEKFDSLAEKLSEWKTIILSKDQSGSQLSVVSLHSASLEVIFYVLFSVGVFLVLSTFYVMSYKIHLCF